MGDEQFFTPDILKKYISIQSEITCDIQLYLCEREVAVSRGDIPVMVNDSLILEYVCEREHKGVSLFILTPELKCEEASITKKGIKCHNPEIRKWIYKNSRHV